MKSAVFPLSCLLLAACVTSEVSESDSEARVAVHAAPSTPIFAVPGAVADPTVVPIPGDCPDGTPCGHPGLPQWGTCLGGFCCTSCVIDGVCAIPNTVTPGVCGAHGGACDPDGASCENGWTCGSGNCGVCAAEKTKCGRLDGIAGWCVDVGGSLACLRYDAPALSSPGCSAGCTDAAAAGAMCQGADGSSGCAPGCCPLKYAVVLP